MDLPVGAATPTERHAFDQVLDACSKFIGRRHQTTGWPGRKMIRRDWSGWRSAKSAQRNTRRWPRQAASREAFLEAALELYSALAASTKNAVLVDLYRSFSHALKDALAQVMVFPGVMKSCLARHERVYQASINRDSQLAETITAQFFERVSGLIEELLGGDSRVDETIAKPAKVSTAGVGEAPPSNVK